MILDIIVAEIILFLIIFFMYQYELRYDFSRWLQKHQSGILIAILVAGAVGALMGLFDISAVAPCRSWGRYASSC